MHRHFFAVLTALPLAFAAACDSDIELPDVEEGVAAPAGLALADHESTAEPQAASQLAINIAQHPAFPTLSARANLRVDHMLDVVAGWTQGERNMAVERLEACRHFEDQMCNDELAAMGVDLTITPAEAQAAQQIGAAFNLGPMPFQQRVRAFTEARQVFVGAGGPAPGPASLPGTFFGQPCDAACRSTIFDNLDASYGGAMAMVIPAPPPENDDTNGTWVTKILIEIAEIAIECLLDPDCNPWWGNGDDNDDPPPECTSDSDCASNQYCWKGPLNIGDNECRSKKKKGEPCSRDGKCLSGCCKFNLWDFGSTCRDADECD